ncbi:Cysteine/Histidine-rich C1 domain family protein [Prunus dulcis]|uniref:Cysteine/Histidine-rich C1 domain family protein n=1 Tax=Prunus dulcis TaxID=3755 RepID=A0A4Y1S0B3_PRUDU|nr:Cysteine/Histidine-rich C1 domain family protein [Prunus dulcis]
MAGYKRRSTAAAMTKFDEIPHPSHPEHKLEQRWTGKLFKCNGCNEPGIGSHYTCPQSSCSFDLHMYCAIPLGLFHHPFQRGCSFQLLQAHRRTLAAAMHAGRKERGCKSNLHPCCAKLPMKLEAGDVNLYLYEKVKKPCQECGYKGKGWSYRSVDKKCYLHVACAKKLIAEKWLHGSGHGDDLQTTIPNLNNMIQKYHQPKGKLKRFAEIVRLVLQTVISTLLGDPTALIAGTVKGFEYRPS